MDAGIADDSLNFVDCDLPPITKSALETELYSSSGNKKQGHVCCGCCCDTRRAVLIINILYFLLTLGMVIILWVGKELVQWTASHGGKNDSDLQQDEQELAQVPVGRLLFLLAIQMTLYACGILGAIQFRPPLIGAAIVAYLTGFAIAAWYGHWISIAINLVSMYPHFFFLKEMKSLVMTPENYPNEVYSFCCG